MRKPVTHIVFWLFATIIPVANSFLFAGDPVKFLQIGLKSGLSSKNIHCFFHDSQGFLWIGTQNGLNRYDGYEFVNYTNDPNNPNSLIENNVMTIYEDSFQNLWLGTEKGIDLFNPRTKVFTHLSKEKSRQDPSWEKIATSSIRDIVCDNKGDIWIATYGNGLHVYQILTNTLRSYYTEENNPVSLGSNLINDLFIDNLGRIWIGTEKGGLNLYHYGTDNFTQYKHNPANRNSISADIISHIYQSKDGVFWIGTWGGGLNKFIEPEGKFFRFMPDENNKNAVSNNNVTCILEDSDGKLWVSTFGSGATILNRETNEFTLFRNSANDPFSIGGDQVWTIYQDNFNLIYFSIWNNGISYYDPFRNKFNQLTVSNKKGEGLSSDLVTAIKRNGNNLWIATNDGGLNKYSLDKKVFTYYKHNPSVNSLSHNSIFDLFFDRVGQLWIPTGNGLNKLDPETGRFTYYYHDLVKPESSTFPTNHGRIVYQLSDSIVLVGTWQRGLIIFNKYTGTYFTLKNNISDTNSISSNTILDITADNLGDIWIATTEGLNKYHPNSKIFSRYFHIPESKSSLIHNNVSCLLASKIFNDSIFWIGTAGGGICRYNVYTHLFSIDSVLEQLSSKIITSLTEDRNGNLWIGTEKGISYFNPNSKVIRNFNESDGLMANVFNARAALTDVDGTIYFGTNSGVYFFNPSNIKFNTILPILKITKLFIQNQEIEPGEKFDGRTILEKDICFTDTLFLPPKAYNISIEFSALHFSYPAANNYKYMLEGIDRDWISVKSDRRFANYTNLKPGTYIFKVLGSNSDDFWNTEPSTLTIILSPPFWETFWFKLLALIFIVTLILLIYYLRISSIKHQKKMLEVEVEKRTCELMEMNVELEEKHEEILSQKNLIEETAITLEEQSEEIMNQKAEVEAQRDQLSQQHVLILSQNSELEKHQKHLSKLVEERTAQLEKAKKQAEESDKIKTFFLNNISHEIRTPLNSIVGFSNLMANEDISEKERKEFSELITTNSNSLLSVINDILEFSEIETGKISLNIEEIQLNSMLGNYTNSLKLLNSNTQIEIKFSPHSNENLILKTDKQRLLQILTNLSNNALKFTRSGYIEVGAYSNENELCIYVKDTGVGIDSANLKYIFEEFRKIDKPELGLYRGLGIGLTIAVKLANLMNAEIVVDSELGKGSCFTIKLPLSESKEATKTPRIGIVKYNWVHKEILIVEDEINNYNYLRMALAKTKAILIWAKNGQEAIEIYSKKKNFDIILMDIKMPIMNGFEALIKIREQNPDQIVIAQTAYATAKDRIEILKAGFNDYLPKPILPSVLYQAIDQFFKTR